MRPLAEKYKADAKDKGEEELEIAFMMATTSEGLAPRIRGMLNLETLPPSKHEHPLEKQEASPSWGCDGCGCAGAGKDRWRCTQGCDFDFCGDCYAKVNSGDSRIL